MKETLSKKETPIIIGAGVIIGIIAVALVYFGNPANMGFCIACFLRDTSGNCRTGTWLLHSCSCNQRI